MKTSAFLSFLLLTAGIGLAQQTNPSSATTPLQKGSSVAAIPVDKEALERWQQDRFGIFIHWGPVSQTGKEISWSRAKEIPMETYDALYRTFNPEKFDAEAWARVIRDSGARYAVLTCKHHDGFCLWDSKQTDYTIMNTPFRRDVVKELSQALRKNGVRFGAYYSTCDWYHPDFPRAGSGGKHPREPSNLDRYTAYLKAQVAELIGNYGPFCTLWFDVPQKFDRQRGQGVINLARGLQPDIVINDRTGASGDYSTPEQKIGGFDTNRAWESCMTVSAHNHWAWGGEKDGVKSPDAIIAMMAQCAGGDGNMLLNVGPRPDGMIDPAQAGVLRSVGDWLRVNGPSIYGTRGGPYKPTPEYASTRRGDTVYLHILKWEGDAVTLPPLPPGVAILSATLPDGGKSDVVPEGGRLTITAPAGRRSSSDTVITLVLDQDAMGLKPIDPIPSRSAGSSPAPTPEP